MKPFMKCFAYGVVVLFLVYINQHAVGQTAKRGVDLEIHSLATDQFGNVFAGGAFEKAGNDVDALHIASWNPISHAWSSLGDPLDGIPGVFGYVVANGHDDGDVKAIAIGNNGKVYAGGHFKNAGAVPTASNIAAWDPVSTTWTNLGSGIYDDLGGMNSAVNAMTIFNDKIYVVGSFSFAGGIAVTNIAAWDINSSSWSSVGIAPPAGFELYSIVTKDGTNFYVGGASGIAHGVLSGGIITWSEMDTNLSGAVNAIAITSGGRIFVGGAFYLRQGSMQKGYGLAEWNGSAFVNVPNVPRFDVSVPPVHSYFYQCYALTVLHDNLIVGGKFSFQDDLSNPQRMLQGIARFDLTSNVWLSVGPGTDSGVGLETLVGNGAGTVHALAVSPTKTPTLINLVGSAITMSFLGTPTDNRMTIQYYIHKFTYSGPCFAVTYGGVYSTTPAPGPNIIEMVGPGYINGTFSSSTSTGFTFTDYGEYSLGPGQMTITTGAPSTPTNDVVYAGGYFNRANWQSPPNHCVDNVAAWDSAANTWSILGNNLPPTVLITSPTDGTAFCAPANVVISASADDADCGVAKVDFYADGNLLGTDETSPYSSIWTSASVGTHSLTAIATDTDGATTTSAAITVNVLSAPTITTQPLPNQIKCSGESVSFSVTADGSAPLSYQWQFYNVNHWENISGETGSSYTIASVSVANAGDYRVIVSNPCGSIVSATAVLTVLTPPTIDVQPLSQTAYVGKSVTFSVAASGTNPLSYQWQFYNVDHWENISGGINSSYTIPSVTTANAGNYRVLINNQCGGVISATASLTVLTSLTISTSDSGSVTFSVHTPALPNTILSVYTSTDLRNWTPMGTVTLNGSGAGSFTDSGIDGLMYKFYKLSNGTYTSQAIGFERIIVPPGTTAIANQLDTSANTLDGLFNLNLGSGQTHKMIDGTALPPGTVIRKWADWGDEVYTWNGTSWSPNGNATLNPGEGVFIDNNSGSPFTVTFAGLVRDGQWTIPLANSSWSFTSSMVPQAGGIQSDLGFNPADYDNIMLWRNNDWVTYIADSSSPTGWDDANYNPGWPEPELNVGEGVWIMPAANESWTRSFSVSY
jgi:hypothetical protein